MTVQIPQTKRDAIFNEYCRIQDKITKVAEKEHKAQLRRRRYVLDAFGKWLDKAARSEVETFLETLSDASSVADSRRIADYLTSLPPEPGLPSDSAPSASQKETTEKSGMHYKEKD